MILKTAWRPTYVSPLYIHISYTKWHSETFVHFATKWHLIIANQRAARICRTEPTSSQATRLNWLDGTSLMVAEKNIIDWSSMQTNFLFCFCFCVFKEYNVYIDVIGDGRHRSINLYEWLVIIVEWKLGINLIMVVVTIELFLVEYWMELRRFFWVNVKRGLGFFFTTVFSTKFLPMKNYILETANRCPLVFPIGN